MQLPSNYLKLFSYLTIFWMYIVLIMGSLVTNTESGDGCGRSWPLCNGDLFPGVELASLIEYSHRAVTGIAGLLVLAMAFWAWRVIRRRAETKWLTMIAVFFLLLESWLGAAAVLWPEPPEILALHMGVSLLSFAGVLLLGILIIQIRQGETHRQTPPGTLFRRLVWLSAFFSLIVIYLGAYVRHAAAGVACQGWPLCNGQVIPELYGSVGIQFAHRAAAGIFMLLILWFFIASLSYKDIRPDLYRGSWAALLLAVLQTASGAVVVFNQAGLSSIMLHSAILPLVFGCLAYLCLQTTGERQRVMPSSDMIRSNST